MLSIYNTFARTKEIFEPLVRNKVKMFVCGPTVYDYIHLGHARTYITYDIMARYLMSLGYDLFYLVNITDIDDAIFERAKEEGVHYTEIVEKYTRAFLEDIGSLNISSITMFAKASDYLHESIRQVKGILATGYAYEADGKVYFDTIRFEDYGKLSGQRRGELMLRRLDQSPYKKNQSDFILWRRRHEEPSWESPFGKGRPGWHIEDTAISISNFGPQYDIHGGAADLIYPHHEAEIAQAEALTGKKPFVSFWVHSGTLRWRGEKMSKSRKNFITVREALQKFPSDALRLYFLSTHYRNDLDYKEDGLAHAVKRLKLISQAEVKLSSIGYSEGKVKRTEEADRLFFKPFLKAMNDDFNAPKAVEGLMKLSNIILQEKLRGEEGRSYKTIFRSMLEVLGLLGTPVPKASRRGPRKIGSHGP